MSNNDNVIFPIQQCEVSQTSSTYNAFDIYLDEEIKDPTYYRQAFQVLRSCQRGDLVRIFISSPGGNLNSALIFKNCIEQCEGDVVAIIEAEAFSAASLIALSCPGIEVKPYATMMLHSASFGSGGSVQNVRDHVEFTGRHAESLMEEIYKDFITEDELLDLKKGRELWFDYKQIGERLDVMFEARQAAGCNDPDCESCGVDAQEEEEQFSLEDMIAEVSTKAVDQAIAKLTKKFDLVPKPVKAKTSKKNVDSEEKTV